MKYFLLKGASSRKDVGRYPQTKLPDDYPLERLHNATGRYTLTNDYFPDIEPELLCELHPKSKLTDVLSIGNISANGLFISQRFRDLLLKFDLMESQFYLGKLITQENELDYYWFHPIGEGLGIDFSKTVFKDDSGNENIRINQLKDSIDFAEDKNIILGLQKIYFNENFKKLDLFFIPFFQYVGDFFISERLKDAIIKNKISGIVITEQNIIDNF